VGRNKLPKWATLECQSHLQSSAAIASISSAFSNIFS
jgi:hypothetical protein